MLRYVSLVWLLPLLLSTAPVQADEELLRSLNAGPQAEEMALPSAHLTEGRFTLPEGHGRPVYLYFQALLKYRALSRSGGVLRIAVNGEALGPAESVNKKDDYWQRGTATYAPRAFALPAQPGFASGDRDDLGGTGYLFDVTALVRAGENAVQLTHAAAAEEVLLRGAVIVVAGERSPLELGTPAVSANDPSKLKWDFGPNIKERKGLFLCRDGYHRVGFRIRNEDIAGANRLGLVLLLPEGVELMTAYLPYQDGWSTRIRRATVAEQHEGAGYLRHTLLLPEEASAAPETDWHTFGGHPLQLFLRCSAAPGEYRMYWQSLSQGGEGELTPAPLTVLPAPPLAPQPRRSMLGLWAYSVLQPAVSEEEKPLEADIRASTLAQWQSVGVSRLVLSFEREIPGAREHEMLVSLASMWNYDTSVYPSSTADPSTALLDVAGRPVSGERRGGGFQWCPTYAGEHVEQVFGPITQRIRDEGWDGFDLDHEGVHHQCFCRRCRAAFAEQEGLAAADLQWPGDVQADGRLHPRWLAFHARNGGRHVAAIREAVKAGNPQAKLFSWFTMSLYEHQAEGQHADAYAKRLREEADYGYDLREFLRHLDYANMANGVYPHGEETWDEPYGLDWAFHRVQATVGNEWGVPLAPCLNIGSGVLDSYTNPDYLRWQAKTHVAQGVRGLDFWMLPFLDGRHYGLFSELARLFAATEDIVWEGRSADELVKIEGPEGIYHHAIAGKGKLLVGITNRSTEEATVTVDVEGKDGRDVLSGQSVGRQLEVPALNGVFVVYEEG